jgi:hypothetical protein
MADTIRAKLAEQLKEINPRLESEIIDALVDRDVDKKKHAFLSVYDKLTKAEAEYKRLGPDDIAFDVTGKKTREDYTKKRVEEIKKAEAHIAKLMKALNKAMEGDYGDVFNLAGGKDTTEGTAEGGAEAAS